MRNDKGRTDEICHIVCVVCSSCFFLIKRLHEHVHLKPNVHDAIWSHMIYYKITWLYVTCDMSYRIELLSIPYDTTKLCDQIALCIAAFIYKVYTSLVLSVYTTSIVGVVTWFNTCILGHCVHIHQHV